jgi:hypothetical protein
MIRSTTTQTKPEAPQRTYPRLVISACAETADLVVLLTGPSAGVIVAGSDDPGQDWADGPGTYSDGWDEDTFVDFDGSVTLQNAAPGYEVEEEPGTIPAAELAGCGACAGCARVNVEADLPAPIAEMVRVLRAMGLEVEVTAGA